MTNGWQCSLPGFSPAWSSCHSIPDRLQNANQVGPLAWASFTMAPRCKSRADGLHGSVASSASPGTCLYVHRHAVLPHWSQHACFPLRVENFSTPIMCSQSSDYLFPLLDLTQAESCIHWHVSVMSIYPSNRLWFLQGQRPHGYVFTRVAPVPIREATRNL